MSEIETAEKSPLTRTAVGFDVRVTWLAIAKMYASLATKFDGTVTMGFVLLNINEEWGTRATKIGPLIGMEPRSLTRLLSKMEEMGAIIRKPDPDDGRSVRIHLTDEGRKVRQIANQNVMAFNEALRKEVNEKKLQHFFDVLEKIYQTAENFKISE